MSGLFGIVDFAAPRIEPEELRRLAELASYRAPGGITCHFLEGAGLAHLALHEERPLLDSERKICVLFDGRLDNRPELIARLSPARGAEASDTELLLAAYLEWGEVCTDRLLGDFAFAIWDAGRRRLFCAVDPLGIKPLHYAQVGSLICFASDAVQVLQHPAVPDGYNEVEIAAYLADCGEDPERSFFAAVHKLGPGRRVVAENGVLRAERYWSPAPKEIRYPRDEDYADRFREILQQAVTDRTRGAGSFVGVAMSGGLDSTSVAALAQRAPGVGVRAYTFVFDQLPECDERAYSRAMTEELRLEVEPVEAERFWSLESRNPLPLSADTPFMGWRTCYQEIFRRMTAQGSRIMLMGHGGDDLLSGSSLIFGERLWRGDWTALQEIVRYARSRRRPALRPLYQQFIDPCLPARADRFLRSALGRRKRKLPAWIHPSFAHRTDLTKLLKGFRPRKTQAAWARQEIYDNLIEKSWYWRLANWHDRNAASFGIEVRYPFLDRRLFEYIIAIPEEQVFQLGRHKNILRRSMTGILPESVRERKKKTRFVPFLELALREKAREEILELLRAPISGGLEIFDGKGFRTAFTSFLSGKPVELGMLWYSIAVEIWLRRCEL
ncbi:MAG: hypothetical protein DMF53_01265, partial [Acidobacteria bacterium]